MGYWNDHPIRFKYLFLTLGIFLFLVAGRNFIGIATTVDDQNIYSDPPSRLYIKKQLIKLDPTVNNVNDLVIPPGSLLLSINDQQLATEIQVYNFLDSFSDSDTISFNTFRPTQKDSIAGINQKYKVVKRFLPKNFIQYLPSAALVNSVVKGGVSDKAGVKSGDIFLKVNDNNFSNAAEAHRIMASSRKNSFIKYDILRDNQVFEIKVKLAKFKLPLSSLLNFILGITIALTGLWIGVFRPKITAARLTGIGFLLIGMLFTLLSTGQLLALVSTNLETRVNIFIMLCCFYFGTTSLAHSIVYFPFIKHQLIEKEKLFKIPYIVSLIATLILFIESVVPILSNNSSFNSLVISNITLNLVILFFVVWYLFVFIRYRSKTHLQKGGKLIKLSYLILLLILISSLVLSFFNIALPPYTNIAFLILPVSYVVTIGKHNLFDNLVKLSKNIQYTFLNIGTNIVSYALIALIIIYFSTIEFPIPNIHFNGRSIEILDNPLSDTSTVIYGKIIFLFISAIIIITIFKGRARITNFLNEKFFIVSFDYKSALGELNELIQSSSTNKRLAESITGKIAEILKLKRAGIMIFEDESKISEQFYLGLEDTKLKEYSIAIEDKLITSISDFSGNVLIDYLDQDIKNIYLECRFKYLVPIRSKTKLLGVLLIGEKKSEASFDAEDLSFLSSIARQSSVAVENASLYSDLAKQERIKQELDIARRIQLSSLPQEVPNIRGLEISGFSIPALEVGGDFYDFFLNEDNDFKITTVIGDVSGKGTSAALYMSKAQGIMQSLQDFDLTPKELLRKTNSLIYNYLEKGAFITSCALQFDSLSKVAKVARAGHLPLYYFNQTNKKVEKIIPKGLVLGMNKGDLFVRNLEEHTINYNTGDVFVLITDGILEARNSQNEDFDEERLINIIESSSNTSAENIKDIILKKVTDYTGREDQFDDLTIVVVKAV